MRSAGTAVGEAAQAAYRILTDVASAALGQAMMPQAEAGRAAAKVPAGEGPVPIADDREGTIPLADDATTEGSTVPGPMHIEDKASLDLLDSDISSNSPMTPAFSCEIYDADAGAALRTKGPGGVAGGIGEGDFVGNLSEPEGITLMTDGSNGRKPEGWRDVLILIPPRLAEMGEKMISLSCCPSSERGPNLALVLFHPPYYCPPCVLGMTQGL